MQDGRWRAALTLGKKADGKPDRRIFTARTRRAVSEDLTSALRDQQRGININRGFQETSFAIFLDLCPPPGDCQANYYHKANRDLRQAAASVSTANAGVAVGWSSQSPTVGGHWRRPTWAGCSVTHQGAVAPQHLSYYLDEYTFG